MAQTFREKAQAEYDWATETLSKRFQLYCSAVIAALWSILTADRIRIGPLFTDWNLSAVVLIKVTFICIILALMMEGVQYLSATVVGQRRVEFHDSPDNKEKTWTYDKQHLGTMGWYWYRLRFWAFIAKLLLAFVATVFFVMIAISLVPTASGADQAPMTCLPPVADTAPVPQSANQELAPPEPTLK